MVFDPVSLSAQYVALAPALLKVANVAGLDARVAALLEADEGTCSALAGFWAQRSMTTSLVSGVGVVVLVMALAAHGESPGWKWCMQRGGDAWRWVG